MTTFEMTLFEGHPIITDSGNRILVDTGSPINLYSRHQCGFLGRNYAASTSYSNNNIQQFSDLIGTQIDMIMGTGILNDYRVLFDYQNSEITFGDEELGLKGESFTMTIALGIPVVEAGIPGRMVQCFLDSGAKLSYLRSDIAMQFKSLREASDFYPGFGHFTTPVYDIMTKLGQEDFMVGYGTLPGQLASLLTGAHKDGILGYDFFRDFKLLLDIKNGRLTYLKAK